MSVTINTTGGSSYTFQAEYGSAGRKYKWEAYHNRTKAGYLYGLGYGSEFSQGPFMEMFEVELKYVPFSDMVMINSWWISNEIISITPASFWIHNQSFSGYLIGNEAPINKISKPYIDQWEGKLLLGVQSDS
jgi:hypothetical protein